MTPRLLSNTPARRLARHGAQALILGSLVVANLVLAQVTIDQRPLTGGDVPGNLVLTPSVEFPTINSVANLGAYSTTASFDGYFDSAKCYAYRYDDDESLRHFYPVGLLDETACNNTGDNLVWSGHYLNWAATQTIDPFRKALTGGLRVRDTPTETWLQKARHDGQGGAGNYPNRLITGGTLIRSVTPFTGVNGSAGVLNFARVRIHGLGAQMRLVLNNNDDNVLNANNAVPYDPEEHGRNNLQTNRAYVFSVRVKVCDPRFPESNCVQYAQGLKPEGLIQEFSERLRYSVFGYLNDTGSDDVSRMRDGGVLRARQKFVGPRQLNPTAGWQANPNREWDPVTGVLVQNPDPDDARDTSAVAEANSPTIAHSGVINYLNLFGELTPRRNKRIDPVSELYYAAFRYVRNLPNVPEYSRLNENSPENNRQLADAFPVITDWTDPYQFYCQPTAILGIGDTNTHVDKNLPGNTNRSTEPAVPPLVQADNTINVLTATNKVLQLEGSTRSAANFRGNVNSAYIAGMAYLGNTTDLRPDLQERQRVSTLWVDVLEGQVMQAMVNNQYMLAAKYGGFRVPDGFDPLNHNTSLPQSWWSRTGERVVVGGTSEVRPDNFFVAGNANRMIQSLRAAFEQVETELTRSGTSFASNSNKLEAGNVLYQPQFTTGSFTGDVVASGFDTATGRFSTTVWRASQQLPAANARNIRVNLNTPAGSAPAEFAWSTTGGANNAVLKTLLGMGTDTDEATRDVVNFIRGDRSQEEPNGALRRRSGLIGSIVNSQPVRVSAPLSGIFGNVRFNGSSSYNAFVASNAGRTPMLYVGANDGMLHGFNANTGAETFAFIPRTVLANGLRSYTEPGFTHQFFLDGEITVADAFVQVPGSTVAAWRTILVGSLGRGGRGLFALDVTNPADIRFLWEINGSDVPALGNVLGKPIIAQVANGDWRVLVGNGPNSTGNRAQLLSIGLTSGIATPINTVAGSVGLSSVFMWDSNNDGFAETAYAGDLAGNVWRFNNLSTATPGVTRLFTAVDANGTRQPITAQPLVARNPDDNRVWVFVGTGRYLNNSDVNDTAPQSWYALIDGTTITSRASLSRVGFVGDFSVEGQTFVNRVLDEGVAVTGDLRGWYFDLPVTGERMVVPNQLRGRVLVGTSRIPDLADRCSPSGRGFIMAVDPFKGGRLPGSFFDANLDGIINAADSVTINGVAIPVSGLGVGNAPFNPLFTDNVLQINREDGVTQQVLTGSGASAGTMQRTSWREIRR